MKRNYQILFGFVVAAMLLAVFLVSTSLNELRNPWTCFKLISGRLSCIQDGNITLSSSNRNTRPVKLQENNNYNIKCCLMTITPIGRLGNLMGEYATLYALAKLNKRSAFIRTKMAEQLAEYFSLSLTSLGDHVVDQLPWKDEWLHDWMEPRYAMLNDFFINFSGYPCSWTFYHHIRDEIVREFTFQPRITREVQNYLTSIRKKRQSVTFVGVHIRRGDYVKLMQTLYEGVLADASYLAKAMSRFVSRYKDVVFVVCSDDLPWAKRNINTTAYDVVFGWNGSMSSPGLDMALLAACNHTIMTIGTFGYWASYLAGGDVIYLSNFMQPTSPLLAVWKYDKVYLPHWEGIDANLSFYEPLTSTSKHEEPAMTKLTIAA